MFKRIIGLSIATLLVAVFFYASRYWGWQLWPREGLWGVEQLRPQGNVLQPALRGTDFAPYDLLLWAIGVFLILTWAQKIWNRFTG